MEPKPESTTTPPASPLKQIRTFQGDVANTIGRQKESLVSIQYAEKARAEALPQNAAQPSDKSWLKLVLLLVGGILLISLGLAGGWYAYKEYVRKTAAPVISIPDNRLISATRTVNVDSASLTKSDIVRVVAREGLVSAADGEVSHINASTTIQDLLRTFDTRAPGNMVRAFEPLFMLGTLGVTLPPVQQPVPAEPVQESPTTSTSTASTTVEVLPPLEREGEGVFLLIQLSSFENAFAGMLAWERNMAEDIAQLFSTRLLARNVPFDTTFTDVTIRNKDARALKDPATGETVLIYSFFNTNILIITDSEQALVSLLGKLTTELLSR